MAGKKAAKKVALKKSAAKKAPGKKAAAKKMAAKHSRHAERDLRRAYEHMGRLETLRPLLGKDAAGEIEALLRFAQGSLTAEDSKSAAELLRAGEHLAFGSLAATAREEGVDGRVQTAARTSASTCWNARRSTGTSKAMAGRGRWMRCTSRRACGQSRRRREGHCDARWSLLEQLMPWGT